MIGSKWWLLVARNYWSGSTLLSLFRTIYLYLSHHIICSFLSWCAIIFPQVLQFQYVIERHQFHHVPPVLHMNNFLQHFSSIPSWSFPAFPSIFPAFTQHFPSILGELQPSPARVDLRPSAGHFGHLVGSGCGAADGGSRRGHGEVMGRSLEDFF